ncbi:carbohydrate ABC transporter membrane protein 2 (CUT1 family) [Geodermatophilus tzadiensis]|uniref:Carbohydrate ABC transporter membrane protein 2 (CUT1 family) n=1 Tax=Geodermatophilus tzadiensis TaxID=1137988 RepID=A0A2T0TRV5_9ACTN|nr:carbohydrate ABC transporter permease [Geodermatophilus tzadiensis]PRY48391.1 carbohydrate ABC transporter membrane protein 2 (CUT1 family) [Geodermatophilus tzadiensis]
MSTVVAAPAAGTESSGTRRPRRGGEQDASGKLFNRLAATCVTLFALIWLVPFLWALITSLRPNEEIAANPTTPWSDDWNLDAYSYAWNSSPLGWWYVNSFVISTLTVVFTVVVCSMAAFALVNLDFRGKYVVFGLVLAGLMVPVEALVLPQFLEFRTLGLLGTYWAVILPSVALPVALLVFHSFIRAIPVALIEAARLDGAGWWRIYSQIAMPLSRPAISAVAILTFITSWNAFLWPLLVLTQTKSQTIPVGLSSLVGGSAIQYAETMASAVLGILPLLAVFLVLQRQIAQGVANTGIK